MIHTVIMIVLFLVLLVSPCVVASTINMEEEDANWRE